MILTSVEEKEDAESSGALFLNLTLEVVRFVDIESETVNARNVSSNMSATASATKNLGDTTNVVVKGGEPDGDGGTEGVSSTASNMGGKAWDWAKKKGGMFRNKTLDTMSEFLESWKGGW